MDQKVLRLHYRLSADDVVTVLTPTFIPPEAINMPGYRLLGSPTLYPGQTVHVAVLAENSNTKSTRVGLLIQTYGEADALISHLGPSKDLIASEVAHLEWQVPELNGVPIVRVGLFVSAEEASEGKLYLDYLSWDGMPNVTFCRPATAGRMWRRQWVNAADYFADEFGEAFRVIQNRGRGLVMTGTREWADYSVQAIITPHLAKSFGLAARVQGQERYYALLLSDRNTSKLVKRLDGEIVLAEQVYSWDFDKSYTLRLDVNGQHLQAWVDGTLLFSIDNPVNLLSSGGIALLCEEGRIGTERVLVTPASFAPS
jgi:hypothetical protein